MVIIFTDEKRKTYSVYVKVIEGDLHILFLRKAQHFVQH